MRLDDVVLDLLDELAGTWREVEIFAKRGRSRTLRIGRGVDVSSLRQEEGWAVRAGDSRRSFFYAASGAPRGDVLWPEADGHGLRLPSARPVPPWNEPADLETALLGENEAASLFDAIARELDRELPGAQLVQGELEDGASEEQIVTSRETRAHVRRRAASLWLEAQGPRRSAPTLSLLLSEREARRFVPQAVARRLADRLAIAERGASPVRDRGEFLLAPAVAIELLRGLADLWIGPEALDRVRPLIDRQGRMASRAFTLVDDGRLDGGVLDAPVDGEGQPTRRLTLVDAGVYRQPLVAWDDVTGAARHDELRATGCRRRPSWRDLPATGPSHLHLLPDPSTSVASLLGSLSRGYYLLGPTGALHIEAGFKRFALPVAGFAIDGGRPTGSVSGSWLVGSVPTLLGGVLAVARDLTFSPVGSGLIGAPTLLVKGLELRHRP
ncbi:MAG: metallopeptidase TldD-related protein [Acidobacteriota bacterium]